MPQDAVDDSLVGDGGDDLHPGVSGGTNKIRNHQRGANALGVTALPAVEGRHGVAGGSPAVGTASIVLPLPQLFQGLDPPAIVGIQLYRTLIVLDSQLFVAVDHVSLAEAVIGVR